MTADVLSRPRRRTALWVALAGTVVLLAVGGIGAYLAGQARAPLAVTGELVLMGDGIRFGDSRKECVGGPGRDDIHKGAQVVVSDASGATIAIASLGTGVPDAWAGTLHPDPQYCAFPFSATVPAGHDFYGITVGKRGTMTYPASALAGPLRLTLG